MQKPTIIGQIRALAEGNARALKETIAIGKARLPDLLQQVKGRDFDRITVLGCGTSYGAAVTCKYVFEEMTGVPADGMPGFSFAAYQDPAILNEKSLVVGFSTAGKTEAIIESLAKARARGAFTIAVTAVEDSAVAQTAEGIVLTGATDEVSIPRTKAQSQGLVALYLLAIRLGQRFGYRTAEETEVSLSHLVRTAETVAQLIEENEGAVQALAETYGGCSTTFVLGSGPNLGTALTGSLMTTELAKIHCMGDEMEGFLHGRFREVDQVNPIIILAPQGASSSRVLDFLTVTDQINAQTVVLTDVVSEGLRRLATHVVQLPGGVPELYTAISYITPLHLFGYHLAIARGKDPMDRRYNIPTTTMKYQEK